MNKEKIYENYYELLNSNDPALKYAFVWWCILPQSLNDYEYSWYFLQKMNLEQIKTILENRLTKYLNYGYNHFKKKIIIKPSVASNLDEEHIYDNCKNTLLFDISKKYYINLNTDINTLSNDLYNIFIQVVKNGKSRLGNVDEAIIHGANRIIRCFDDAGLIKIRIRRDAKVNNMISNYAKDIFKRNVNFKW